MRQLIEKLYGFESQEVYRAIEALGAMGERAGVAAPFLASMQHDRQTCLRTRLALAKIGRPALETLLVGARAGEDHYMIGFSLEALEKMQDVDATEVAAYLYAKGADGRAAGTLEAIGRPAVERLLPVLAGPDPEARAQAAKALGLFPSADVVQALSGALKDDDAQVRGAALGALAALAARTQGALKPGAGTLQTALRDSDAEVRQRALALVAKLTAGGDLSFVELLGEVLRDPERSLQLSAVEVLASLPQKPPAVNELLDERAVPALTQALADVDARTRCRAVALSARLGRKALLAPLLAALKDEDTIVRERVIAALSQMKAPESSGPLMEMLGDRDAFVRRAAAETLGALGDKQAVVPLKKLLEDSYEDVRGAARRALFQLDAGPFEPVPEPAPATGKRKKAESAPARLNSPRPLPVSLVSWPYGRSARAPSARRGVSPAEETGADAPRPKPPPKPPPPPPPPNAGQLRNVLRNNQPQERARAVEMARRMDQNGMPCLREFIKDRDLLLRAGAVYVIGQIRHADSAAVLFEAYAENQGPGRENQRAPQDNQGAVRDEIEQAFTALKGQAEALALLQEAFKAGARRQDAAVLLGALGDAPGVELLTAALQDSDWHMRCAVAEGLGHAKAVAPLRTALQDRHWYVRKAAAEALGATGERAAIPALIAALSDEHWFVCRTAQASLVKLTGQKLDPDPKAWREWWEKNPPPAP